MVTIINFKERTKNDGTSFFVLEVQSGVEMVQSQKTGQLYATAQKAYIPSTFDELTCSTLIGIQLPGGIKKVACDPYEYTIQNTCEVVIISHRNQYIQEEKAIAQNSLHEKYIHSMEAGLNSGKPQVTFA